MTQGYFKNFPVIEYGNTLTRSITSRVALSESVLTTSSARQPLDITPGMRPDVVASRYYQDPGATWIVLLSAGVIDPWWDWYQDEDGMAELAIARCGSTEEASLRIRDYALGWASQLERTITPVGWDALNGGEKKYWEAVYGVAGEITAYRLRREDWRTTTNFVLEIEIEDASGTFDANERCTLVSNGTAVGACHVVYANSSIAHAQHISGNSSTVDSVLTGANSGATAVLVESSITYVIPQAEQDYWVSVSEMDFIREQNEKKSVVMLLDSRYAGQAQQELRKLLR